MAKKRISLAAAAGSAEDAFVSGAPDAVKPKEKMTRVNFDLDSKTHMRLKMRAVERGTSIKDLLIELIEKELSNA